MFCSVLYYFSFIHVCHSTAFNAGQCKWSEQVSLSLLRSPQNLSSSVCITYARMPIKMFCVVRKKRVRIGLSKMRDCVYEIWVCCDRIKFTVHYWRVTDKDVRGTQYSHKNINKFLLERMSAIKTSRHRMEWQCRTVNGVVQNNTLRCTYWSVYFLRCHLHIFNGLFVYLVVKWSWSLMTFTCH